MEIVEKFGVDVATVLVVDVQNDFCHPRGVMAGRNRDLTQVAAMIPRLQGFVAEARRHLVPVVWIRTTHDDLTNSAVWLARASTTLRTTSPPPSNCWTGSWGAEFFEVAPEPGEAVVTKHRYSAFAGTTLDWVLRTIDRPSLLVAGVSTETCVESTVRDALFHDYHVNLVEDCCAAYSAESHAASVRTVRELFGLVTTSDAVAAQWEAETADRPPVASARPANG